jgi:hypothetical protein
LKGLKITTVIHEVENLHLNAVKKLNEHNYDNYLALKPKEVAVHDEVLNHANSVANVKKQHQ